MASVNQCIGSCYDELKHRVFYFNWNSDGYNGIYMYDIKTKTINPLLVSLIHSTTDILNFSPNYPIASVNILYRTEEEGDILHWTDRNQRPMKLNIKDALDTVYASDWKKDYLTVSRKMPLIAPVCAYGDDLTKTINNLKSNLFQFSYRWVYKDNTKSTWSPWSKSFAPYKIDTLSIETNPSVNNYISVLINTGPKDALSVEFSARGVLAGAFSDRFIVYTLNKKRLAIGDDVLYTYKFYNDSTYEYADKAEGISLFDYVPKKANTQELLNGNILSYGGITEGVTFDTALNVTKNLTYFQNAYPLTISSYASARKWTYVLFNSVTPGDVIDLKVTIDEGGGTTYFHIFSYTVVSGDTLSSVNIALKALVNAYPGLTTSDVSYASGQGFTIDGGISKIITGTYAITYSPNTNPLDVNTAVFKPNSTYRFGMVYFDEYGVTNGVVTNDTMVVNTREAISSALGTDQFVVPNIQFSINHTPPSWAKYFSFVRTSNLTYSDFKFIISDLSYGVYRDTKYGYINIKNYNTNTSGYPSYDFTKGDRIRIYGTNNGTLTSVKDYPILDMLTKHPNSTVTGDPSAGFFLKLEYDSSFMSGWPTNPALLFGEYYIEVYTPSKNADSTSQLFYEFGETYAIGTDVNSNRVHLGQQQNQVIGTGAQPAVYNFFRGDVYLRQRDNIWIFDRSISDKFDSKVPGTGRVFVIDEFAKETYYPTLHRYSLDYQQGTNINMTNRFYAANMDEYDRQKGDIQRFKVRGRQLRVFQSRACGVVPIYQNIMQTASGDNVVSQSTEIVNRIQYYSGEFGIGNQYCSLASSASADYFSDPIIGCQVRVANDGLTSITELYKGHFYFTNKINKYQKEVTNSFNNGKAKILGVYDGFEEEFITCMQASASSGDNMPAITFGFSETRNAYTAFYDYYPEWICSAGNLVISWRNGKLWTHDNETTRANFYNTQYTCSIKLIFNETAIVKKHFNSISLLANDYWLSENQGDVLTNMGNESKLIQDDYRVKDDKYHAAFKRDMLSVGGLYNGRTLHGSWLEINLKALSPQNLVNLYYIDLSILEPFNNR